MPGLFITATGTDVGKTYITAGLIRAGRRAGRPMGALKPVLTGTAGTDPTRSDAGILLAALGRAATAEAMAGIAPFRFAAPLSPNMAARLESRTLDFAALVDACRTALAKDRLTLVEGIGGVMVPLDDRHTVLDLIAALRLPVVLVSGTMLGALSHCLTAYAVLQARRVAPALVVLNESAESTVPLAATHETLVTFCPGSLVNIVPRNAGDDVFDQLFEQVSTIVTPSP